MPCCCCCCCAALKSGDLDKARATLATEAEVQAVTDLVWLAIYDEQGEIVVAIVESGKLHWTHGLGSTDVDRLAADCVREFDRYRGPLSAEDRARQRVRVAARRPGAMLPSSRSMPKWVAVLIVAICSAGASSVDGIRHDFERQRFTDLGDYATFLAQVYAAGASGRPPTCARRCRSVSRRSSCSPPSCSAWRSLSRSRSVAVSHTAGSAS